MAGGSTTVRIDGANRDRTDELLLASVRPPARAIRRTSARTANAWRSVTRRGNSWRKRSTADSGRIRGKHGVFRAPQVPAGRAQEPRGYSLRG
jgi:hypothetical protein